MSQTKSASYRSDGYNVPSACEHCQSIISHERWCLTQNPIVSYARKVVVSPDELTVGDAIILHSLGVLWNDCRTRSPRDFFGFKGFLGRIVQLLPQFHLQRKEY